MTETEFEKALARTICDSITRTTPNFRWWRAGLLLTAVAIWVVVLLVCFGLVAGVRA